MQQHELRSPRGARRPRKRIGRGNASGTGTYAGKGMKGQQARSGYKRKPGFEGGQTPLIRRLPTRRGFRNPFRIEFTPINVKDLARFPANSEVTPETLRAAGLIHSLKTPVKVLGNGELSAALTVRTHRVSAPARAKIEAAGGTVEELMPRKEPKERKRRETKPTAQKKAEPGDAEAASEASEQTEDEDDDGSESSESADTE